MSPVEMPRESSDEKPAYDAPWLITFSDLFCLMLSFFVLLFSMSSIESGQWETLKKAFSNYRETPFAQPAVIVPMPDASGGVKPSPGLDLGYLGKVFEAHAKDNILLQKAVIYRVGEKLVISLPADILFAPGSAAIEPKGRSAIFGLAGLLNNIANDLAVMGHTDPRPVSGTYSSNWELSLARAAAVAAALQKSGYGRPIDSFGAADSHFAELPESVPLDRRRAMARRVDVIMTPNG